jgi:hypothetical protein
MGIYREAPRTTVTTTFTCERCHVEAVVTEEVDSEFISPSVGEQHLDEARMPDKWRRIVVGVPIGEDPLTTDLVFCQRACMSTWLGEFVRRVYGEDVENKPARVSRKRARKDQQPLLLDIGGNATVSEATVSLP